jgi:hypothetical protein
MIDSGIEPVVINATTRVRAYYDEDSYSLDYVIGDELGVYTLDISRGHNNIEQGDRTADLDRLIRGLNLDYRTDWRDIKRRALELYFHLSGLNYQFVSLRGYSQSDWADVAIYTTDDYDLKSSAEALDTWFKGDVFTVCLEKLETYTSPLGKTIDRWEIEDSIGCVTFSEDYTLETCAKDYFGYDAPVIKTAYEAITGRDLILG